MVNVDALHKRAERVPPSGLRRAILHQRGQSLVLWLLARIAGLFYWLAAIGLVAAVLVLGYQATRFFVARVIHPPWADALSVGWTAFLLITIFSSSVIARAGSWLHSIRGRLDNAHLDAYFYAYVLQNLRARHEQASRLSAKLDPETPVPEILKLIQEVGDAGNQDLVVARLTDRGRDLFAAWQAQDLVSFLFAMYPYDESLEDPRYSVLHHLLAAWGRERSSKVLELLVQTNRSTRGVLPRGGHGVLMWLSYQRYIDEPSLEPLFRAGTRPTREPWYHHND